MTNQQSSNNSMLETKRKCVMCKQVAIVKYRPFCSKRCADLDLGKWLNASYIISDVSAPDDNDFSSDYADIKNKFD